MTKPTKCVRPAKTQINLGIRPVWSESSLCAQWVANDPSFLRADSEDSDQTGRMHRLIWVFAGRTVTLLILPCRGSYTFVNPLNVKNDYKRYTVFRGNLLCMENAIFSKILFCMVSNPMSNCGTAFSKMGEKHNNLTFCVVGTFAFESTSRILAAIFFFFFFEKTPVDQYLDQYVENNLDPCSTKVYNYKTR